MVEWVSAISLLMAHVHAAHGDDVAAIVHDTQRNALPWAVPML